MFNNLNNLIEIYLEFLGILLQYILKKFISIGFVN